MPTYQYVCTECGEPLEAVQKFTDDPLTECPACHGRLRKVFNSVGIVFKGSGFYRTDSRNGSTATSPAAVSSDSNGSSAASSSDSSGSSSAAAAKSESSSGGKSSTNSGSSSGSSAGAGAPATKAATA